MAANEIRTHARINP